MKSIGKDLSDQEVDDWLECLMRLDQTVMMEAVCR